jgi:hypothetical protein
MIPRDYIDIDRPVLDYTDQARFLVLPIFTSSAKGDRSNTTTSRGYLLDGCRRSHDRHMSVGSGMAPLDVIHSLED